MLNQLIINEMNLGKFQQLMWQCLRCPGLEYGILFRILSEKLSQMKINLC